MSQRRPSGLIAVLLLLCLLPVSVAYASLSAQVSNVSPQAFGSGSWSASAGLNSAAASTGSAYGPIIPANANSCVSTSKLTEGSWTANDKKITLNNITDLVIGMTVTGTGISSSGTNTITSFNGARDITLASGPNNSPPGTQLFFSSGVCTWDQYLSINNDGLTNIASFTVIATSSTTSGSSIALQACTGGTWNETTDACSGVIQTLTTTIGSGIGANSPQSALISIPIVEAASLRLRALSTQSGASLSVGIQVAKANLRSINSSNG